MNRNDEPIDPTKALTDQDLVARLRRIAGTVDPVPDHVVQAARAAITTRDLDGELAALVADSAVDDGSDPGSGPTPATLAFEPVRTATTGTGGGRVLSFAGANVQVDLEVTEHDGRLDLIGMLTGAPATDCLLEHASGERRVLEFDVLGRFVVTGVRPGLVRVRWSTAGVRGATAWVRI